ncbi:MAG TPA: hypothetical protein PKK40_05900, partial [Marmoricola sp.]|nr:hypothetical protein [Marmoricola sp.]
LTSPQTNADAGSARELFDLNRHKVSPNLVRQADLLKALTDQHTGAHLYRTTSYFLERIGISSLDELPELAPLLPDLDDLGDFTESTDE